MGKRQSAELTAQRPAAARWWLLPLLVAALLALALAALTVGPYPLAPVDALVLLLRGIFDGASPESRQEIVLFSIRLPRVVGAMTVGGALAAAGAAYQGMFRNPLVSPDILGVSTGAALGAVLGIFLSLNIFMIQMLAFAGGLVAVGLVYWIG
jgi:iron complex transport system permease protein